MVEVGSMNHLKNPLQSTEVDPLLTSSFTFLSTTFKLHGDINNSISSENISESFPNTPQKAEKQAKNMYSIPQ